MVDMPSVPTWVRNVAAASSKGPGPAVLVLELGEAKFEAEVLLDMLTSLAREIRAGRFVVVVDAPETVNDDPYGQGWLIRIRLSSPDELGQLLDVAAYKKVLDEA